MRSGMRAPLLSPSRISGMPFFVAVSFRQALDQDAGSAIGTGSEHQTGVELHRGLHVVRQQAGNRAAFQSDDALVRLLAIAGIKRQYALALACQRG